MILRKFFHFFDLLENKIRQTLSRHPFIYAFLGGVGVVVFWRGVWVTSDFLMAKITKIPVDILWWDGPLTVLVSLLILSPLGIFVSSFIGNEVIISGIRGEKKMFEKTEAEIESELTIGSRTYSSISEVVNRLKNIDKKLDKIK
jgi:hypothetical protein